MFWESDSLAFSLLNYGGVFVFALSGGLAAVRKEMDYFGVIAVAILPGIGGGTIRDLILDAPVFWLEDTLNLIVAVIAGFAVMVFSKPLLKSQSLAWFDAAGLALFAVSGAAVAIELGYNGTVAVVMGAITATCGGVLRDIVCNDVPMVLQKDIYAVAALIGALIYYSAHLAGAPQELNMAFSVLITFAIRGAAIRYNLGLPRVS